MENQNQKWVNLSYLAVSVLLGYLVFLVSNKVVGAWDLETRVRNIELFLRIFSFVIGAILFIALYRSEKINQFMNEVVVELSRVTWPTQKDTGSATVVVIIMVVASGLVLGLVDFFVVQLMRWIL